jgi:hypothetical protein
MESVLLILLLLFFFFCVSASGLFILDCPFDFFNVYYYTSLTSHWLKLNHMTWNNFNVLWKLTQTGNNYLRASKGKQLFSEVTLSVLKILLMTGLCPISLIVLWTLISTWNSLTFVKNLSKVNMKQAWPWMLANLKIIWQFHAHPVHQKVSRIFGPRYIGDDFFLGPNLVSFNRTVVPYEISKVNFRVETKILVSMSEEI